VLGGTHVLEHELNSVATRVSLNQVHARVDINALHSVAMQWPCRGREVCNEHPA
jgi:hypothetical protein